VGKLQDGSAVGADVAPLRAGDSLRRRIAMKRLAHHGPGQHAFHKVALATIEASPARRIVRGVGRRASGLSCGLALVASAVALLAGPASALAGPAGVVTEFSDGISPPTPAQAQPNGITAGPDGNIWFAETPDRIGRVTPAGVITEFPLFPTALVPTGENEGRGPTGIATGPDGNLWFTESGWTGSNIGRITTAGVVTEFALNSPLSTSEGITAGPDGNLWFTEANPAPAGGRIGQITTAGVVTEFPIPSPGSRPYGIAVGSDGNLWFTDANPAGYQIGRITTAGVVTEFPLGAQGAWSAASGIAAGPDGNLWFTDASLPATRSGGSPPRASSPSSRSAHRGTGRPGSPPASTAISGSRSRARPARSGASAPRAS
jgi:streptogramin lyase